ncbi:MAG: PilZ domain-containing protein [Phycisphaerae bacterium]|jgi:hypothetical protein
MSLGIEPNSDGAPFSTDGGLAATVEDRRAAVRMRRGFPIRVASLGQKVTHSCHADDISEGGLFVRVPTESGLTVGQRCELTFEQNESEPDAPPLGGDTCYATVVRTKLLHGEGKSMIGAGLRFDQPLYL